MMKDAPLHPAIQARLYGVLRDHFVLRRDHPLGPATRFAGAVDAGGLDADSLDMIEIAMLVEEEFAITVPDHVAAEASTIGEVERWLADNLRHCRQCGCTENRACLTDGKPCGWASTDVCTACAHNRKGEAQ